MGLCQGSAVLLFKLLPFSTELLDNREHNSELTQGVSITPEATLEGSTALLISFQWSVFVERKKQASVWNVGQA